MKSLWVTNLESTAIISYPYQLPLLCKLIGVAPRQLLPDFMDVYADWRKIIASIGSRSGGKVPEETLVV